MRKGKRVADDDLNGARNPVEDVAEDRVYPVGSRGTVKLAGPMSVPLEGRNRQQLAVVEMMRWAWSGYEKFAWGRDVLNANTRKGEDWNGYGLGVTIVDSLDTLYLLGMTKEFDFMFNDNALSLKVFSKTKGIARN